MERSIARRNGNSIQRLECEESAIREDAPYEVQGSRISSVEITHKKRNGKCLSAETLNMETKVIVNLRYVEVFLYMCISEVDIKLRPDICMYN